VTLFESPTIEELSVTIEEMLIKEIKNMSEEEAELLLSNLE
jgi:hypothetical protein